MPRGIIQKPRTGRNPKIPPQTSNRPSTNRNPGATFCLTHASVRLTRHLIHSAKFHWFILVSPYSEITPANMTTDVSRLNRMRYSRIWARLQGAHRIVSGMEAGLASIFMLKSHAVLDILAGVLRRGTARDALSENMGDDKWPRQDFMRYWQLLLRFCPPAMH